jgi:hypothetical protein
MATTLVSPMFLRANRLSDSVIKMLSPWGASECAIKP